MIIGYESNGNGPQRPWVMSHCCGVGVLCVFMCVVSKCFPAKEKIKNVTQMWPREAESTEINYRRPSTGRGINI